jgi:hypothetical protein
VRCALTLETIAIGVERDPPRAAAERGDLEGQVVAEGAGTRIVSEEVRP